MGPSLPQASDWENLLLTLPRPRHKQGNGLLFLQEQHGDVPCCHRRCLRGKCPT